MSIIIGILLIITALICVISNNEIIIFYSLSLFLVLLAMIYLIIGCEFVSIFEVFTAFMIIIINLFFVRFFNIKIKFFNFKIPMILNLILIALLSAGYFIDNVKIEVVSDVNFKIGTFLFVKYCLIFELFVIFLSISFFCMNVLLKDKS